MKIKSRAIYRTFCFVLLLEVSFSKQLDQHSFEPPFSLVDYGGSRLVSRSFSNHGYTTVNKNFARLTSDRQNKQGALYSEFPLRSSEITAHLEFRISGQGDRFFGDGLALWITHNKFFTDFGKFHGFSEAFQGVGIIVDTFRNTEFAHKDITVVVNDGTKDREAMARELMGCDAEVRFHEKRADFDPEQTSRLRVSITEQLYLRVEIDDNSQNDWQLCTEFPLAQKSLPSNWLHDAYIGITATTGQLADNHDVISLHVTDVANDEYPGSSQLKKQPALPAVEDPEDLKTRIDNLEHMVTLLLAKFASQETQLDHKFADVEDHIQVSASKLRSHEEDLEDRIEILEEQLTDNLHGVLNSRVSGLEDNVRVRIGESVSKIEDKVHSKVTRSVMNKVDKAAGGWKIPFMIIIMLIIAGAIVLYQWWNKMKKMHLL